MNYLPAILALLIGAAGWFYMFYSRAASNLTGVEAQTRNRLRIRLRRVGGLMMIVLAFVTYATCLAVERALVRDSNGALVIDRQRATEATLYLMAVMLLMVVLLVLGLIDLRLTQKLRKSRKKDELS